MTDKYVRVPVDAVEQIAEMRDTAMRNIESSPMKYSADWCEVAQLLDWLCGEIAEAPSVDIKQCPECAGLGVFAADHNFPCPECSGMGLVEHVRQTEPASVEPVTMPYLLRKGGMWYAHNSSGYTARAELAELYTKNYADTHASHHDDVSAIPLNEIISSSKQLDPFIERMRKMQEALECAAKPLPPGEE